MFSFFPSFWLYSWTGEYLWVFPTELIDKNKRLYFNDNKSDTVKFCVCFKGIETGTALLDADCVVKLKIQQFIVSTVYKYYHHY